jgi:hypothetical protein
VEGDKIESGASATANGKKNSAGNGTKKRKEGSR